VFAAEFRWEATDPEVGMARAIWTGAIGFGLVSIPVKLMSATQPKDVRFHELAPSGARVHHKRVAGRGQRQHEVEYDDIVKGYEVEEGEYVVVTPKELEAIQPGRTRTIEIEDFVELAEIDPIYFEKTYYVVPEADRGAEKPYAILLRALDRAQRVGIGRFVFRTKQHLIALRPAEGVLALETLFFSDEVRAPEDLGVKIPRTSAKEVDLAERLIEAQATSWRPAAYKDTYRQRVLKLIRDKAKGKEIVVDRGREPAPVQDLMEALRASVDAANKGKAVVDIQPRIRTKRASEGDLEALSKGQLLERAKRQDVEGRSRMTKDELIEALRKAS
jgi:DNA end-binding protein Ku